MPPSNSNNWIRNCSIVPEGELKYDESFDVLANIRWRNPEDVNYVFSWELQTGGERTFGPRTVVIEAGETVTSTISESFLSFDDFNVSSLTLRPVVVDWISYTGSTPPTEDLSSSAGAQGVYPQRFDGSDGDDGPSIASGLLMASPADAAPTRDRDRSPTRTRSPSPDGGCGCGCGGRCK